ncbi:MAG TPA: hypothetical protein VJ831_09665 [Jatrophihabitantaceae bacterium]|nr:hypothetical protein [Jatrophihabitantaceae bacterium]
MRNDDYPDPTPTPVIWSVALGVGPLPFLGVYSVLFIAHGFVYPVNPPDITSTQHGEGVSGIIAAVLFLLGVVFLWWYLNGKRRWPFVIGQLATFVTCVDFILDSTTGSPAVPLLLVVTSGVAIVLALLPAGWDHTGFTGFTRFARPSQPSRHSHAATAPRASEVSEVEDPSIVFGASDVDAAISSLSTRSHT